MKERKLHEILQMIRIEKGVSQDVLCYGLCNKSSYSKYEYGERVPDRLLLNVLFQRLGKNPDKLETILTEEEYWYFLWKKKILTALSNDDMIATQELLKEPEAMCIPVHENLKKQFYYQMQTIVAEAVGQKVEVCIDLLELAVELTMPDIRNRNMKEYLISAEEMELLLNLAEFQIKGNRKSEGEILLKKIVSYVEEKYDDYEMKVKIYPEAVKMLLPLLYEKEQKKEGMLLCKKAIDLLCWQGVLFDLTELMEWYLKCNEGLPQTEEAIRYEKQLQALREVYEEYHAESYLTKNTRLTYSNRELYLINEVIQRSRKAKKLSQEKLSEDICTPETLSRIESGKRSPSTKNFRALMKKLETDLDYYSGELDTNDFLLLEKKLELNRAISLQNWNEAQELLEYLKERLDMSSPRNQRILQAEESGIAFSQGRIKLEEFQEVCEEVMNCQGERWREEAFWNQFFTHEKVILMNYIAVIYYKKKQLDNAIYILEHLLEHLRNSKVKLADRYKSSITVVENLSSNYGENGDLEKCIEMSELGIDICLKSGRGIRIGKCLGNKAEAMNDKTGNLTEQSRQQLKNAYYLNDLFWVHSSSAYIEKYYRLHYETDIIWY